ncbi:SGNH/GDSL hydrolase family protein [Lachnospiraceae bacterium OttesenSCG-928-D06]|nr:SGNH/GDSL hydrolase family protein [Lachnospiraceae bacterium OttesenSCG-928-D06]
MKKQFEQIFILISLFGLCFFTGCNGKTSSEPQTSSIPESEVQSDKAETSQEAVPEEIIYMQEFDSKTTVEKNGLKKQYLYNITLQEGAMYGEFQQRNTLTLHSDGSYLFQKQLTSVGEADPWEITVTNDYYGTYTRAGDEIILGIPDFAESDSEWGNLNKVVVMESEHVTSDEAPRIMGEFATSFLGHRNLPEPIKVLVDEESMSFTLEYEYGTNMFGNAPQYSANALTPLEDSPIKDKTILFLGSSVTFGSHSEEESFVEFIKKLDGINEIKEAVPGTTLSTALEQSYVERLRAVDTDLEIDAMLCQLSTNDAGKGVELGNILDGFDLESFDTDTIAGAIEYIICYTRENWDCPVIFYTNPKYNSAEYAKMVDTLLSLQEKWDITVIDFWNDSQVNETIKDNYLLYMSDTVHPTKAGYLEVFTSAMQQTLYELLSEE